MPGMLHPLAYVAACEDILICMCSSNCRCVGSDTPACACDRSEAMELGRPWVIPSKWGLSKPLWGPSEIKKARGVTPVFSGPFLASKAERSKSRKPAATLLGGSLEAACCRSFLPKLAVATKAGKSNHGHLEGAAGCQLGIVFFLNSMLPVAGKTWPFSRLCWSDKGASLKGSLISEAPAHDEAFGTAGRLR